MGVWLICALCSSSFFLASSLILSRYNLNSCSVLILCFVTLSWKWDYLIFCIELIHISVYIYNYILLFWIYIIIYIHNNIQLYVWGSRLPRLVSVSRSVSRCPFQVDTHQLSPPQAIRCKELLVFWHFKESLIYVCSGSIFYKTCVSKQVIIIFN